MISTHILDTSRGIPTPDVMVRLEKKTNDQWSTLGEHATNQDGRVKFDCPQEAGDYRLTFYIEEYAKAHYPETFFLNTPISFRITNTQRNYHVPLLLNPYGLSTYRGS